MLNVFSRLDNTIDDVNININDLLKTAAVVFARKGFSNASFSDIAVLSEISEAQIKNKFESKEKLYKEVICYLADSDNIFTDCRDLVEMLISLIEDMQVEIREQAVRAQFFSMFIGSKDIPEVCIEALRQDVKSSKLYAAFAQSQMKGEIKGGNTYEVLSNFIISVFTIIEGYVKAGLELPDNEFFLQIIDYTEPNSQISDKELIRKQTAVIEAFASEYQSILFVDLDTDSMEVYYASGEQDNWIVSTAKQGYEEYRRRFTDRFIPLEDRDWYLKQVSPEIIKERLLEDPVYLIDHKAIKHGEVVSYLTKIVLDPMCSVGNRVLIGGRRIYE